MRSYGNIKIFYVNVTMASTSTPALQMKNILETLGLGSLYARFKEEKITPDIVCMLSLYDFHQLGMYLSSEIMNSINSKVWNSK